MLPGATAGDKPQPYIFLCGHCSWFPDCRFSARFFTLHPRRTIPFISTRFVAAGAGRVPTHEGSLKPALRWSWPRRAAGRPYRPAAWEGPSGRWGQAPALHGCPEKS